MQVGRNAAIKSFKAFKELSGNLELKIENPAGLGAFARIVKPPPANAPETKAHFEESVIEATCDPK